MNINTLDLNLLRIFCEVAEAGNVSRAAERLGLSQPAVSNALKRLRDALDDPLLVRGAGGMVPTPRGEDLAQRLSDLMQGVEAAITNAPEINPARINEPIIITCADEEILLHGPDILAALDHAGCTTPVQFLPMRPDHGAEMLWRKRLAITITTMLYAPEELKQRKLYEDHLVCLMRSDHPAAAALDLEAYLAAEHLLIAPLGGAPKGYLDDWLREQGQARKVRLISHTFGSAASLVLETGLIATLPNRQAARHRDNPALRILPLPAEAPPFSVHMFWSERYDNDPVNAWLRGVLYNAIMKPGVARASENGLAP